MVNPSRLRRLPVALLVVAVTAAGAATALASTSAPAALPDSLFLAEPRLGDRGAYRVTLEGNWTHGWREIPDPAWREPWTALSFEWTDAGTERDGEGRRGPADLLRVRTQAWDLNVFSDTRPWTLRNATVETYFPAGGQQPFRLSAEAVHEGFADPATLLGTPLPGDRFGSRTETAVSVYREDDGLPPPTDCIAHFGLQGQWVPARGRVPEPAPRECRTDLGATFGPGRLTLGGRGSGHPTVWEAAGWEEVGGVPAVRLEAGRLTAWLNPAIPVPVRFAVEVGGGDEPSRAIYDLVSFEHGVSGRADRGAWEGGWPALDSRPLRPWGLDEDGIGSPFPAEAAFGLLASDPAWAAFRREHPDAYLVEARFLQQTILGETTREWGFAIANGTHGVAGSARERVPEAFDGLPAPAREAFAGREAKADPPFPLASPIPMPEPGTALPTAGAVAVRWREAGGAGEANGWSYQLRAGADGKPLHLVGAGRVLVLHRLADPGAGAQALQEANSLNLTYDWATMDAGGGLWQHAATYWESSSDDPILPAPPPEAAPAGSLVAPRPWVPTAAEAAGVGLAGILAGLAYYLWPNLRLAAVGLFSRADGPALLENPARARLVGLVQAHPGIHFKEMQRLSGMANGTLVHHLQKLAAAGLVVARRMGKYTCYFPPGAPREGMAAVEALKAPGARRVLATVRQAGGLGPEAIAQRSGLAVSTVHYHVQRLEQAGLVQVERDGRLLRVRTASVAA